MSGEAEPTSMYGRRDQKPCPCCSSDDFMAFSHTTMCGNCYLSASPEAWARRTVTYDQLEKAAMALRGYEYNGDGENPYPLPLATRDYWMQRAKTVLKAAGFEVQS